MPNLSSATSPGLNKNESTEQSSNITDSNSTDNHEHMVYNKLGSLAPECDLVKSIYDSCFQEFFPKFLRGMRKDPCEQKFKVYQNCLREALRNNSSVDLKEIDALQMDPDTVMKILNQNNV